MTMTSSDVANYFAMELPESQSFKKNIETALGVLSNQLFRPGRDPLNCLALLLPSLHLLEKSSSVSSLSSAVIQEVSLKFIEIAGKYSQHGISLNDVMNCIDITNGTKCRKNEATMGRLWGTFNNILEDCTTFEKFITYIGNPDVIGAFTNVSFILAPKHNESLCSTKILTGYILLERNCCFVDCH